MCTLIVGFWPGSSQPLIVGANRDENPKRPAEPWDHRDSNIFSPLDIMGGTWIGTNLHGMFCAITNWDLLDDSLHGKGFLGRGVVVYESLKFRSPEQAVEKLWATLDGTKYKPFNILLGNKEHLFRLSCDNSSMVIEKLKNGLHISTGFGFNCFAKRELYIKNKLWQILSSNYIEPKVLKSILAHHNDGIGSEHSVCVHDEEHRWETRSSAVIEFEENHMLIHHTDMAPCQTEFWKKVKVELLSTTPLEV